METTTEVAVVDPKEYGIEEKKASQIKAQFDPMLNKMAKMESEFNDVIKMPIEEASEVARELRLRYVKVRTGTGDIHKEQKSFYIAAGKYIDGFKNAQLFASQGIEEKLMSIEKHAENLEVERINKLQETRGAELLKYNEEGYVIPDYVGGMEEETWNALLAGAKSTYEAKIFAEKKVEEERIKNEASDKLERERELEIAPYSHYILDGDVFDLRSMTQEGYDTFKNQLEVRKKEADKKKEETEAENKRLQEEALEKDRLAELENKKQQDIINLAKKKTEKEALARKAAEDELKAKRKEEEDRRVSEEAGAEKELQKGDAAKMKDLKAQLFFLGKKFQFKSKKNNKTYEEVGQLLGKIVKHIEDK